MAKNIVIFSDGTGQAGGLRPDQRLSNIYKLYRASRSGPDSPIDPAKQIAFYDPGLGSGETDSWWQWARKTWSSATGTGFTRNVADCYEFILRHYQPDDRVFLFGFSRGAYTARSVGGVMNLCGVPIQLPDGSPVPRFGTACRKIAQEAVYDVYEHGAGKARSQYEDEREEKARRFREKYGTASDHARRGNVAPYFIGVFDTVAALGLAGFKRNAYLTLLLGGCAAAPVMLAWAAHWLGLNWTAALVLALAATAIPLAIHSYRHRVKTIRDFPKSGDLRWHWSSWKFAHYDKFLDPRVRYARHALAIDEHRETFDRVGWAGAKDDPGRQLSEPEWLIQMWFAGNHSDIGGSYPEEESRLSDIALQWMVNEATGAEHPLIVDREKLKLYPDPLGMQHCEIEAVLDSYPGWWPEKPRWTWRRTLRSFDRGYARHSSVDDRMKAQTILKMGKAIRYDPFGERDKNAGASSRPRQSGTG
ncbi:DUF2235 domain-containing protein [Mesorhizobium marinum]|uniref:DUF2235 domain-containing protein n=1 Tax=Mesorhizobium marinum TaxID=3228790 RepID=A0ABV3QXB1_9HYPH